MTSSPGLSLDRRLGPFDASAIIVSNVIGGGIFFVPILVAQLVPDASRMLFVWLAGGCLSFAGAMAYAELAAFRPRAGGEYVYLREAFGPMAAFLTGWTSFIAGFSGAIASSSLALANYLGRFAPIAADETPLLSLPLSFIVLSLSPKSLIALLVIAGLALIHVRGLGPGRVVQNFLAAAKVIALVGLLLAGLTLAGNSQTASAPNASAAGLLLSLIPVMFAYSGWNAATYVAEEVREPGRNVPIALAIGTAVVTALYLGLNVLFLKVLGAGGLAAMQGTLMDAVAERLFGVAAADIAAIITILSLAASVSAMMLAGPRVYFAMARDRMFPARVAQVHPQFHTPTMAIVAQAAWSGVLVLSGTLAELVSYTGFAIVIFSGVAVTSVFVLRRRHPDVKRPFRAWGYPWAPAIFVAASALMVGNEIWRNPRVSAAGLAVIAAGLPVYWWMNKRATAGA